MYRRPKFLEVLHEIREQMSREANYDVIALADAIRNGARENESENNADGGEGGGERVCKDRKSAKAEERKIIYGNRL